jgi:hypothetical protein
MIQTICESCGGAITIADATAPALCATCAKTAGLAYPHASARPAVPCARCQHRQLLRIMPRERTTQSGGNTNMEQPVPMALTYARGTEIKSLLDWTKVPSASPDLAHPFGILEAWVCRRCGFVEWYAQQPEQIPVGALFGTQVVDV